jgi:small subunit ribosomal protein S5e
VFVPHTAGRYLHRSNPRYQRKKFQKALCPAVERLAGALMFHGRNTGKKAKALTIIKQAFEIINLLTGKNPVAVYSQYHF